MGFLVGGTPLSAPPYDLTNTPFVQRAWQGLGVGGGACKNPRLTMKIFDNTARGLTLDKTHNRQHSNAQHNTRIKSSGRIKYFALDNSFKYYILNARARNGARQEKKGQKL